MMKYHTSQSDSSRVLAVDSPRNLRSLRVSYGKSPKMTFMFEWLKRFPPEVPAAGSSSESSTGAAEGASSWDSGEANSREQWPPQYPLLPAYRVIVRACQSFSTY